MSSWSNNTRGKRLFGASTPKVDPNKCVGCGKCVQVCPHRAIKMA
ncbi:4Fe-4S binding protein [Caloramator sp. Dgby_cultured_2]|nr:4Fe-4S binding protein [Caloramator sp. Dgby_cultured_2]WDU83123.1 4Fe-4S binding protein [Caloramator sp. Dgby_cultured_2]